MSLKQISPIDRLFAKAKMQCTKCGEPAGTCDCWIKCPCGWSFYKEDKTCNNPKCTAKGVL